MLSDEVRLFNIGIRSHFLSYVYRHHRLISGRKPASDSVPTVCRLPRRCYNSALESLWITMSSAYMRGDKVRSTSGRYTFFTFHLSKCVLMKYIPFPMLALDTESVYYCVYLVLSLTSHRAKPIDYRSTDKSEIKLPSPDSWPVICRSTESPDTTS